jgi:hypothetical protein
MLLSFLGGQTDKSPAVMYPTDNENGRRRMMLKAEFAPGRPGGMNDTQQRIVRHFRNRYSGAHRLRRQLSELTILCREKAVIGKRFPFYST